ncbi:MAG TPA: dihydrolipoyl dehydrogenase [Acidimicrobiales bacterium]|nr:dihydrolipoyl dehydrogenase [Acidimicrobiales bacterium]
MVVPTAESFDVVVIGGGPGGYAAALYGGLAGLRIAVVEKEKVGGTCLHRGCIPAKELLETAAVYRTVKGAGEYGIEVGGSGVDFSTTQVRKRKVIDQLHKGLQGLLKRRKVVTFAGTGQLLPGHKVRVEGTDGTITELEAPAVILATGSVPRTIPGFEVDGRLVMTSDEVLELEQLPGSAVIIGGGVIGCEFASVLADMGVRVTVLEALPKILPGVDKDVADVVVRSFTRRGIAIRTGVTVNGHSPSADGKSTAVQFVPGGPGDGSGGGAAEVLEVEAVVVSVGRRPLSDDLVAPGCGVEVDERGFVKVDELMQTSADGVWAVGDVVATPGLAHVGFAEGMLVIDQVLGRPVVPIDYGKVPWCVYTFPEVAFAGYSEEAAREAGFEVVAKKDPYSGNGRALIIGEPEGLVKVIAEKLPDGKAGRLLGVHMVGPWVTEQLGQGYLALNWDATVDDVAQFVQPHPSLSEVFGETMLALAGRGLHVG